MFMNSKMLSDGFLDDRRNYLIFNQVFQHLIFGFCEAGPGFAFKIYSKILKQ